MALERTLVIASNSRHLSEVRDFVKSGVTGGGFPEELANQVSLAVDEAVMNAIEHAYGPGREATGRIRLWQRVEPQIFSVVIEDDGDCAFDPQVVSPVEIQAHVREGKAGGLGLQIMRSIMDFVEFSPAESNGYTHRLLMIRHARKEDSRCNRVIGPE